MALLLKNKTYLKIDMNGNYIIYKNKAARNRIKKATSSDEVLKKYIEIITERQSTEYIRYHEYDGKLPDWLAEFKRYSHNLINHNDKESYPLMKEYISDVDKTIPNIVLQGRIGLPKKASSLEEVYTMIKQYKYFGEEIDIEDI